MTKPLILFLNGDIDAAELEGKTFQVHVIGPSMVRLYPVVISEPDTQCPVIIDGQQCGEPAGHAGKHCWAGGD